MKALKAVFALVIALIFSILCYSKAESGLKKEINKIIDLQKSAENKDVDKIIDLPKPTTTRISLDDAIKKRRTDRNFDAKKKVTLQELSNILYAMQGKTDGDKRAVPSAHGVYPLGLYIVVNNVDGLEDGLYKMDIPKFKLIMYKKGDFRSEITAASGSQDGAKNAQLRIVVTCKWKGLSGDIGKQYGIFEAGAASQNAYLMAAALGLKTIPMGGIDTEKVSKVIGVKYKDESPVIVNCIGR
jgi:SagB-type dehydrogenase family enzyme